jgi:hypothetical protein
MPPMRARCTPVAPASLARAPPRPAASRPGALAPVPRVRLRKPRQGSTTPWSHRGPDRPAASPAPSLRPGVPCAARLHASRPTRCAPPLLRPAYGSPKPCVASGPLSLVCAGSCIPGVDRSRPPPPPCHRPWRWPHRGPHTLAALPRPRLGPRARPRPPLPRPLHRRPAARRTAGAHRPPGLAHPLERPPPGPSPRPCRPASPRPVGLQRGPRPSPSRLADGPDRALHLPPTRAGTSTTHAPRGAGVAPAVPPAGPPRRLHARPRGSHH